jgi:hypothetical protein
MKKEEIKVGGVYLATVNGKLTRVRVDSITEPHYNPKIGRHFTGCYRVTNLSTGRKTVFPSVARFRSPAPEDHHIEEQR